MQAKVSESKRDRCAADGCESTVLAAVVQTPYGQFPACPRHAIEMLQTWDEDRDIPSFGPLPQPWFQAWVGRQLTAVGR
jgi:hypothetical protein